MTMIRSSKVARKLVAHLAAHGVDASADLVKPEARSKARQRSRYNRPRGER